MVLSAFQNPQGQYHGRRVLGAAAGAAMRPLRVLLVDDHDVLRSGLARLLAIEPDLSVVGQARDGLMAVEMSRRLRPDVVLMDVTMPHCDGVEATRRICSEQPGTVVIGLSMHEKHELAVHMLRAGAATYVRKDQAPEQLVETVRQYSRE